MKSFSFTSQRATKSVSTKHPWSERFPPPQANMTKQTDPQAKQTPRGTPTQSHNDLKRTNKHKNNSKRMKNNTKNIVNQSRGGGARFARAPPHLTVLGCFGRVFQYFGNVLGHVGIVLGSPWWSVGPRGLFVLSFWFRVTGTSQSQMHTSAYSKHYITMS